MKAILLLMSILCSSCSVLLANDNAQTIVVRHVLQQSHCNIESFGLLDQFSAHPMSMYRKLVETYGKDVVICIARSVASYFDSSYECGYDESLISCQVMTNNANVSYYKAILPSNVDKSSVLEVILEHSGDVRHIIANGEYFKQEWGVGYRQAQFRNTGLSSAEALKLTEEQTASLIAMDMVRFFSGLSVLLAVHKVREIPDTGEWVVNIVNMRSSHANGFEVRLSSSFAPLEYFRGVIY